MTQSILAEHDFLLRTPRTVPSTAHSLEQAANRNRTAQKMTVRHVQHKYRVCSTKNRPSSDAAEREAPPPLDPSCLPLPLPLPLPSLFKRTQANWEPNQKETTKYRRATRAKSGTNTPRRLDKRRSYRLPAVYPCTHLSK